MSGNHTKALSEVVSLEAWHTPVDDFGNCHLHIDVSFLPARVGEEKESKVRFHLGVKRAEISFHIPPTENIKVLQRSVAKEPEASGKVEHVRKEASKAELAASASAKIAATPTIGSELKASTCLSTDATSTVSLSKQVGEIVWRQFKNARGEYSWEARNLDGQAMDGRPWDPIGASRLQFKIDQNQKLEPNSRVYVSCRREDLDVKGIEVKGREGKTITDGFKKNREAAASAFIKSMLEREKLQHGDLNEKFSHIILADTVVDPEVT